MIFLYYLIGINFISFIVMLIDKNRARRHQYRVPENWLFLLASVFGSVGIWSGMYLLRHKTRHPKFVIGVPLILIIEVYLIYKIGIL